MAITNKTLTFKSSSSSSSSSSKASSFFSSSSGSSSSKPLSSYQTAFKGITYSAPATSTKSLSSYEKAFAPLKYNAPSSGSSYSQPATKSVASTAVKSSSVPGVSAGSQPISGQAANIKDISLTFRTPTTQTPSTTTFFTAVPSVSSSVSSLLAKSILTVSEANRLGNEYGVNSNLFASSDVSTPTITKQYALDIISRQIGKTIDANTGLVQGSVSLPTGPSSISDTSIIATRLAQPLQATVTPAPSQATITEKTLNFLASPDVITVSPKASVVTKELTFNTEPVNVPSIPQSPATVPTESYRVVPTAQVTSNAKIADVLKEMYPKTVTTSPETPATVHIQSTETPTQGPAGKSTVTPSSLTDVHIDPNKLYVHKNGLVDVGSGVQDRINAGGNPADWSEKDTGVPLVPPSAQTSVPVVTPGTLNQTMIDKSLTDALNQTPGVTPSQPSVTPVSPGDTTPVTVPSPFDLKTPKSLTSSPGVVNPDKPPETVEEIISAAKSALDKYNPGGINNGDNRLIADYYPKMAGPLIQGVGSPHDVAESIRTFIALEQGDGQTLLNNQFAHTSADYGGDLSKSFDTLTEDQQKTRLAMMWKTAIANGSGAPVAASATRFLIDQVTNPTVKHDLLVWAESGGLADLVNSDLMYTANQAVKSFLASPAGQATIGGAISAVGIAATLASGGTLAAAGMVGFGLFGVTEIPNYFQAAGFLNKQSLQLKGQYAPDKAFDYEQKVSSTKDLVKDLNYNQKNLSDEARKTELERANQSYKELGKDLAENWNFLESQGTYDQKLQEYKDLGSMLNQLNSLVDPTTGVVIGTGPTKSTTTIIPPTGGRIQIEGVSTRTGEPVVLERQGSGTLSFKVYDKAGNLVKSDDSKYWDGQVTTLDYTNEIAFPTQMKEQAVVKESTVRPVTLRVGPGQTAEMMGKKYYGGTDGMDYLVQAPVGTQASIKFSSPGQDADVLNTMVQDQPTQVWYKELSDSFKPYVAPTSGIIDFNLKPNQQLYLDGVLQDPKYNQLGRIIPAGAHSAVVKEEGKDDVTQTIFVDAGKATAFTVQGKDVFVPYEAPAKEPFVPYSKGSNGGYDDYSEDGGGGGGGGGYGGGSYGGSAAKETLIVFGPSLAGAKIWLDTVEIAPVIGTAYSTTPGYHAFKATKEGYQDYEKTLYAMDGQTLNVDVVFVVGVGNGSQSTGTFISFGATFKDAHIWLDAVEVAPEVDKKYVITPGYHAVKATKEGFLDWSKSIYISIDATISVDADWQAKPVVDPATLIAKVVFGASAQGAIVYVDEVLLEVVVGTSYEYPEGYHGIRMVKTGYSDWIKTVYLQKGDTLTVSPVFELLPVDTTPVDNTPVVTSKRVYINSDVAGCKILVNGGFTGQWTPSYIDLERGIYKVTCQKTGYDDFSTYVYVGDTIAFGLTAKALAEIAGWEVPV